MGAVIICDLTNGWSTIRALNYYNELCRHVGENIPVLLVANKCDILMSKEIEMKTIDTSELLQYIDDKKDVLSEIRRLAENMNTEFIITSAKTNVNISTIFELMTDKILKSLYNIVGGINIKIKDVKGTTTCPCIYNLRIIKMAEECPICLDVIKGEGCIMPCCKKIYHLSHMSRACAGLQVFGKLILRECRPECHPAYKTFAFGKRTR